MQTPTPTSAQTSLSSATGYSNLTMIEQDLGRQDPAPDAATWMQKAYAIRSAHAPAHPDTDALRTWLASNGGRP